MFYMILKSKPFYKEEGCKDARIVLLAIVKGSVIDDDNIPLREFSTHMQIIESVDEYGTTYSHAHGHYYQNLEDALEDFKKRELF